MAIAKDKILQRLKEHLEYAAKQGISPDRVLGIFLYGSQNYGFANQDSDVDSKIIIIPTLEEMVLQKEWLSKELHYQREHIEVKDIRELILMFKKQNINYLEILYTEYFILNPKYEEMWKIYFNTNRELISHYDMQKAMKSISGQLIHTLRQEPTDNKKLYDAYRLYFFLQRHLEGVAYLTCLKSFDTDTHTFLWDLKYGLSEFSQNAAAKLKSALDLEKKVFNLVSIYEDIDSPYHEAAAAAMEDGLINIIKVSLQEETNEISKADFFKQLTNAEEKAYYSIIKEIGAEGNITITKLIEKNSISRPVYNNLINKMKENKVAEITNQGMKGTHIKIIHPELKVNAIDF